MRAKGLTVIAQRTLELSGTEQSAPGLRDQIKGRLEDTDRALGGHLCQNALPRSNTVSPSLMVSST